MKMIFTMLLITALILSIFEKDFALVAKAEGVGTVTTYAKSNSLCEGTIELFTGDVNLSEEGSLDWKHWGSQTNEKSGSDLITDISAIGNAAKDKFLDDSKIKYSWNDGTPTSKGSSTGGKHTGNANTGGLTFKVPAEKDDRILNVYGSAWGATGTLSATLDDGTSCTTTIDSKGEQNIYYHVKIYFSSSQKQDMTIKLMIKDFYDTEWGNVSIHAASLGASQKPIIYLNGEQELTMRKTEQFMDPFVKAFDKATDITDKVTTKGSVDTSKYGTYKIEYNVTNNGKAAEPVTRTVHVVPEDIKAEAIRESNGSKTVKATHATPGSVIKLYDNTLALVKEATANTSGEAIFENLTSISYRVTQVIDGKESNYSDKVFFKPELEYLPRVVLDDHPEWEALYNAAWEFHRKNTKASSSGSGITDYYVDENFDSVNIYQWDILFMALFNVYGYSEFPGIDTLDNFYRYQEDNGFICRVIKEDGSGNGYGFNSSSFDAVNPPIFASVEWKYYQISGDSSRFNKKIKGLTVLERLEKLFFFIKNTRTYSDGTYKTNGQANGMDNTPGYDTADLSWVDLASQQAQSAYYISKMAEVAGDFKTKSKFDAEYNNLKKIINEKHWDKVDEFYYMFNQKNRGFFKDKNQRTPMGWWPMAANISADKQAESLVYKYIMNPNEFWRPMGISTVSRQSSYYDNSGNYWQGGVWAPTAYMTNIALKNYGYYEEASQNAIHYLNSLNKVFTEDNKPFTVYNNAGLKVYDVNNKYSKTLWEMYQPEYIQPGGVENYNAKGAVGLVRKDFVGWTGLAPIAMMIEDVLGFDAKAPENTLEWRLNLTERNGIENFRFNDNLLTITAEKRTNSSEKAAIKVSAKKAFKLKVNIGGEWFVKNIPAGVSSFALGVGSASESPVINVSKSNATGVSAGVSSGDSTGIVDLTKEGVLDWILCGQGTNKITRKDTSSQYISGFRPVGTNDTVKASESGEHKFSWSDGKTNPNGSEVSTNVTNYRSGQGFEFTAPAGLTERILKVYVSSYAVDSKLDVEISDGSFQSYIDYVDVGDKSGESRVYTVKYRASRDNQFVTVRFTAAGKEYDDAKSGVSLHAVTLSGESETNVKKPTGYLLAGLLIGLIAVFLFVVVKRKRGQA